MLTLSLHSLPATSSELVSGYYIRLMANHHLTSCAGGHHNMPPPLCNMTFDLLTLKVVLVTCDVDYLCANFSLPRPFCSRY